MYRDRPRTLNGLKPAITAYIRNISQADLQKVFVNKIKWVQACIDARGHHFRSSNTCYECTATLRATCSLVIFTTRFTVTLTASHSSFIRYWAQLLKLLPVRFHKHKQNGGKAPHILFSALLCVESSRIRFSSLNLAWCIKRQYFMFMGPCIVNQCQ